MSWNPVTVMMPPDEMAAHVSESAMPAITRTVVVNARAAVVIMPTGADHDFDGLSR